MSGAARLLTIVLLGIAMGACGASGDEAAVKDVMERHVAAIAEGDGEAACRDLTARARRLVVISFDAAAPEVGATTCAEALGAIARSLDGAARNRLRDADDTIEIRADGTAVADSAATTGETELRKVSGEWVITRINFGS